MLETQDSSYATRILQALLEVAGNSSETSDRRAGALEALQEVVEAIDNAADLHKADGVCTLAGLLTDTHSDVRRAAAWAVGAAAQNNAEVQRQVGGRDWVASSYLVLGLPIEEASKKEAGESKHSTVAARTCATPRSGP